MQPQGLSTTLKGHDTQPAGHDGGATTGARATVGRLSMIAFVVGAAVGSWSAWGMTQLANPAAVPASPTAGPVTSASTRAPSIGRSVVLSIPRDNDYLKSTSIPIAGFAVGRPHGPTIKSVHVELLVGGRVVDSADIDVFSGRFAGVLSASGISGRVAAQLRITNLARNGTPILVTNVTIDRR